MADRVTVPKYQDLLWPTVQALRELGGSGSIAEIEQTVAAIEKFTDAQQSVLHGDGPKVNQIITVQKPITRDNLAQVVQPGWDPASVAPAWIPGDQLFSDSELDGFFNSK